MVNISELADSVERQLQGRSLDAWEIMTGQSRTLSIEVKEGAVDTFKSAEPVAVSIRLLKDGGLGFSYSSSFAAADIERMIAAALTAAQVQTPDSCNLLPAPAAFTPMPELYDPALAAVPVAAKIARAIELERLALAADSRITRVRKAVYGENSYYVHLRNSLGICAGYRGSSLSCSVAPLAEASGESQLGWDFAFANSYEALDIAAIATGAAARATAMLGARTITSMRAPVILDSRVAGEFLELLAPSFSAENLFKGKSLLKGREGERLFPEIITIRDDGTLAGGMATAPFDGEGVPAQNTPLVTGGVVNGFLFDSVYAARMGAATTGNSARAGVKGLPHLGISNFFIENGTSSPAALLAGISRGLLLTSLIGMHTANPVSGDFSVGATGCLIENGQLTQPVKGVAIAGNVLELFKNIEMVGSDRRFYSAVGSPSLKIASLEISGD
jgi:PmbA protein